MNNTDTNGTARRFAIEFTAQAHGEYLGACHYTSIAVAFSMLRFYRRTLGRDGQFLETGARAIVTGVRLIALDGGPVRIPAEIIDADLRGTLDAVIFAECAL